MSQRAATTKFKVFRVLNTSVDNCFMIVQLIYCNYYMKKLLQRRPMDMFLLIRIIFIPWPLYMRFWCSLYFWNLLLYFKYAIHLKKDIVTLQSDGNIKMHIIYTGHLERTCSTLTKQWVNWKPYNIYGFIRNDVQSHCKSGTILKDSHADAWKYAHTDLDPP